MEYKGGETTDSLSPSAYLLAYGAPLRDLGSRTKRILCALRPVVNVNVSDEGMSVAQIGVQLRKKVCERIEVHDADGTAYGQPAGNSALVAAIIWWLKVPGNCKRWASERCGGYCSGSFSSSSLASLWTSVVSLKPWTCLVADFTSTPVCWQSFWSIWSIMVSSCSASMPT